MVLAPAFPWLYTPFHAAIGHHRRNTGSMLRAIIPGGLKEEKMQYLDAVGRLASARNKIFLKSAHLKLEQIRFWDRFLIPFSSVVDPITWAQLWKVGAGWRKAA